MNDSDQADWMTAFHRFVTLAAKTGRTVTVNAVTETYSPADAARLLGVSRSTVQRAIQNRTITTIQRGTYHRIPLAELRKLSAALMRDAAEAFADDDF